MFLYVRCWLGRDLILRHDGDGAARLAFFVDLAIHDRYALEILLNDFFPGEFDVLFRLSASPFSNSVDHVLFYQDPNLLGQIGTGREFRHPLADNLAFRQVSLALADKVLVA